MSAPLRPSLCISRPKPDSVIHEGDEDFEAAVHRHYAHDEAIALEQLVQLKSRLRQTSKAEFLPTLCDGLSRVIDVQYVFVSKRVGPGPSIGEQGSCLLALCWYWNHGDNVKGNATDVTYHAFSCPCDYMKYDKIMLIPDRLQECFPNNPNAAKIPIPGEAYFAIPLYDHERCIGHVGLMWTQPGLKRKKLSWAFVEMICHAVEDFTVESILGGAQFLLDQPRKEVDASVEATHEALRTLQSFKPFARSLSHELRTPMHGIIGMLDLMHATMEEAAHAEDGLSGKNYIAQLKEHLSVIQDSSKRAVEAADNVVQAYSLNMGLPELGLPSPPAETSLDIVSTSDHTTSRRLQGPKRRLEAAPVPETTKKVKRVTSSEPERTENLGSAAPETFALQEKHEYTPSLMFTHGNGISKVNLRDLIDYVVNESLRTGTSQELSAITTVNDGLQVEVETRLDGGAKKRKTVRWKFQKNVPQNLLVDERDLTKMISCVLQNAMKFCNSGTVSLDVNFSQKQQCIKITISDTGPGIPEHFRSRIFKPFSREDDSTTRQSEGLGLGLLVAKGLARKIGGDLLLLSSDTSGDKKGSTFEMRVPISPYVAGELSFEQATFPELIEGDSKQTPEQVPLAPTEQTVQMEHHANASSSSGNPLQSPPQSRTHESKPQRRKLSVSENTITIIWPDITHDLPTLPQSPAASEMGPPALKRPMLKHAPHTYAGNSFDRKLAETHPLTFLVAEDNSINRRLIVSMLTKLGYDPKTQVYEAYDGADAVRQVEVANRAAMDASPSAKGAIDVILMDLWMPVMDGYEAAERILQMFKSSKPGLLKRASTAPDASALVPLNLEVAKPTSLALPEVAMPACAWQNIAAPTILAITADATDGAADRAMSVGMEGFMVKPFRVKDLERLIREGSMRRTGRGK